MLLGPLLMCLGMLYIYGVSFRLQPDSSLYNGLFDELMRLHIMGSNYNFIVVLITCL